MVKFAASIMCANQLNLKNELENLQHAQIDMLHCDIMDGIFVNNLAMGPYILEQIKENTDILLERGANVFVLGTSSIFNNDNMSYYEKVMELRDLVK